MLLDRLQHVGEAPEHVRPDRLAFERARPHPRQRALVGGDAEMIGPEHHQPFGETAIGDGRALQPRQRLGAKRLLDDVERLRRRLCRTRLHRLGRRHRGIGITVLGGLHSRILGRDVLGNAGQRKVSPLHARIRRRRAFSGGCRRARLRRRVAGLLDLELIVEHRLAQRRGRRQAGHFEQHAVGTGKFGLDEAARIGGGVDEIAGRAAAGAEAEAIERNEGCLRIAGHRISLEPFPGVYCHRV